MLASQQVVARIVELLIAAGTVAGARVYSDRFYPTATFPAVKVVVVDEDFQADDDGEDITWPAIRLHRLQLELRLELEATAGLDAALAAFVAQVVLALEGTQAAKRLLPLVGCNFTATGWRPTAVAEGQAANGQASLRAEVLFRTQSNNPETLI